MIRIICRVDDASMAANVGGSVQTEFKTFDIEHPELEAWLKDVGTYSQRYVAGAERIEKE